MRSKSAQATAILGNPNHGAVASVTLYNSSGGTTAQVDEWLLGVEVKEDLDSPRTATLQFLRQVGLRTLSPLGPHASFNPFSGEAVLGIGRRVKVSVDLAPDALSGVGSWLEVFDGFVDEVEWASETVVLTCTDRRAKLRDTWIERERVYGFAQGVNATRGCYIWKNDLAFSLALNDLVIPSEANRNGHYYKVTAASGAQGTTEPAWPTGSGASVVSGGVTLTEAGLTSSTTGTPVQTIIQQLIDDNGLSSIATLQTPVSPSWNVRPYIQERISVWDACAKLADQLGWSLAFKWSAGLGRYELTLDEPNRSATTAQRVFRLEDEMALSEASVDVFSIRNVVQVTYGDSASRTPSGQVPRKVVVETDAASVAKYGRRFMEIQEADASQIDTSAEASRMAAAILADLSEPTARVLYRTAIDPFLELNDLIELPADNLRWSTAQKLAVESLTHNIVPGEPATTSLSLRGKPASRRTGWFSFDVRARYGDGHKLSLLLGTDFTIDVRDVVGGMGIEVRQELVKDALARLYEIHVGDTDGFTPSDATLVSAGAQTQVVVPWLVPGRDYHTRVIPYAPNGERIVRGEPSASVPFTAGRGGAGHLALDVDWGRVPLNGGFETWNETGSLPDHWEMGSGTWGDRFTRGTGDGAASGNQYVINTTNNVTLDSIQTKARFSVITGRLYFVEWLLRIHSSTTHSQQSLFVRWYSHNGSFLSEDAVDVVNGDDFGTGVWHRRGAHVIAPAGATFAKLRVATTGGGNTVFHVDSVRMSDAGDDWMDLTLGSGWAEYSSSWSKPSVRRDAAGRVHLRGMVKRVSGSGSLVASVPAGFEPPRDMILPLDNAGAHDVAEFYSSGAIYFYNTPGAWLSFDSFSYDTLA